MNRRFFTAPTDLRLHRFEWNEGQRRTIRMRAVAPIALLGAILVPGLGGALAAPEDDLRAFRDFYQDRFPEVPFEEFANGVYAIDEGRREEWEQIEEFPPYEFDIDAGEELFHEPFANGKSLADCFPDYESGVRQSYPYWDRELGEVVTLEWAINRCRERNGEKRYKYFTGPLAQVSAYLAFLSRGNVIDVKVPADDPRALAAYEDGKRFFYSRRGQLNFACSSCHIEAVGMKLRAERLGPALGQVSHFPVFRKTWRRITTLHRSYAACNRQLRAASFRAQSRVYRNLEYFHTYMSNGVPLNGPSSRY